MIMNTLLAAVSGQAVINAVIMLVVAGLILWILNWAITAIGLPEPFAKVAKVIIILFAAVVAINALLTLVGKGFVTF